MNKGGYQILDLQDVNLVVGTKTVIKDSYNKIEGTRKVVLLTGLVIANKEYRDYILTPTLANSVYTFDIGTHTITVDSGDNVLATAKAA